MTSTVELAHGIRRTRATNMSPLTGTGTNTYLLGSDSLAIIDPGPDLDSHLQSLMGAIDNRPVEAILVTHAHRDHSALAPRLSALTGAKVLAFGTATDGISQRMAALAARLPTSGEGLDTDFRPDHCLRDGEILSLSAGDLRILHTPGHLGGHLCLAMGDLLFSGDHVMGWASSIVSPPEGDMSDYMASLHRLAGRDWSRLFPGHGEPIDSPERRIRDLITHRQDREAQILSALTLGPATPAHLTAVIYRDIPRTLWPAAERNVLAHLVDLEGRMQVRAHPDLAPDAEFRLA